MLKNKRKMPPQQTHTKIKAQANVQIKAQMNVRTSKYTGITFNGTYQSVY